MGNFAKRINSMFKSQKKVWTQLATDINAEFVNKGMFKANEVVKKTDTYVIKLDSYTKMAGNTPIITTRFLISGEMQNDFEFLIKRKNIFNKKAPKGLEIIQTEYQEFDRLFRLFATNRRSVNRLFDRKILAIIANQQPYKDIRLELKENNLELQIKPLIKDIEQLKSLLDLMELLWDKLANDF